MRRTYSIPLEASQDAIVLHSFGLFTTGIANYIECLFLQNQEMNINVDHNMLPSTSFDQVDHGSQGQHGLIQTSISPSGWLAAHNGRAADEGKSVIRILVLSLRGT